MNITRDSIVEVAISILNRDGIENLTMRVLARALGIKAASLYNYIRDKQNLYDLIAEKISSDSMPRCGLGDPKQYLLEVARLYRSKLLEIRDSVSVITHSRQPVTPIRSERIKNNIICFMHLGIKTQNCTIAADMWHHYILSFVADEFIRRVKPPDVPHVYEDVLGNGYKPLSFDEEFEKGIEVLLSGFNILK
jgi:AcrR family transcriptional regulator